MFKLNETIFKELGLKYNISSDIVRLICSHPFIFAKEIMQSENDHTDIMLAYLFKIKLKNMFKENKNKPYSKTKSDVIKKTKSKHITNNSI